MCLVCVCAVCMCVSDNLWVGVLGVSSCVLGFLLATCAMSFAKPRTVVYIVWRVGVV
jgi:hypothetical protein